METKRVLYIIIAFIAFLILSFFIGRCTSPKEVEKITVTIPGASGKSDTIYKPIPIVTHKDSLIFKDSLIVTENPFNKELANRYIKLENETAKLKEYLNSIQIREYQVPFEDENIKITGNFKTQGELLSTQYEYDIKPKEIDVLVPSKSTKFALYAGGNVESNLDLNKAVFNAQIGIQNSKGDIYTLQYGTDKSIQVGYQFRILNVKN